MPQGRSHERRKQLLASSLHNPACYAEALEIRRLLTGAGTLVTVGAVGYNGTSPLQISSGQSVTLTADVRQLANGTAVNANPTGTVSFYWDESQGTPSILIGNASSSSIVTPVLDTQYTGTFTLSPLPFLEQDNG